MNKRYQINERIRVPEVRVIGEEGENLGVMASKDALKAAKEEGKDLVIIVEKAQPPVAKIVDFNKFLYDEKKKASAAKAKSKKSELKELQFGPNIGEGDLNQRIERAREFLGDNNRVRVTVKMRGREQAFPEIAFEKIDKFTDALKDIAKLEATPKKMGNTIRGTLVHK